MSPVGEYIIGKLRENGDVTHVSDESSGGAGSGHCPREIIHCRMQGVNYRIEVDTRLG